MRFDNLVDWLKNPELLDRESLLQLRVLLDEYPCFAVARTLYLKNLMALNDLRFSKELILTALSVPDRKRLYYFIEDKQVPETAYSHENELSAGEGFSIIDRFLNGAGTKNLTPDLLTEVTESESESEKVEVENAEAASSVLTPEESSFSFDYASYLGQSDLEENAGAVAMPGQDLIDAFLDNAADAEPHMPRLKKEQVGERIGYSETSGEKTEELSFIEDLSEDTFTETLAKIYLKQKRYDRALEIFKTLSLKYPEKNVYFADQIRFLEKLIINIKNT